MMDYYTSVELDENGYPVLRDREPELIALANAKLNKTVSHVSGAKRTSDSGNPWFDPRTGRFANGPPGVTVKEGGALMRNLLNDAKRYISEQTANLQADAISAVPGQNGQVQITVWKDGEALIQFNAATRETAPEQAAKEEAPATNTIPEGIETDEWHRRMDAVRDAAREFDSMSLQDAKEFLQGKTARELTQSELEAFLHDVHMHKLSDLVDVLDNTIRKSVADKFRARRTVRVVPPRGWVKRTLAALEDEDIAILHSRLTTRGFSEEELDKYLIGRYPEERRAKLDSLISRPNKEKAKSEPKDRSRDNRGK